MGCDVKESLKNIKLFQVLQWVFFTSSCVALAFDIILLFFQNNFILNIIYGLFLFFSFAPILPLFPQYGAGWTGLKTEFHWKYKGNNVFLKFYLPISFFVSLIFIFFNFSTIGTAFAIFLYNLAINRCAVEIIRNTEKYFSKLNFVEKTNQTEQDETH